MFISVRTFINILWLVCSALVVYTPVRSHACGGCLETLLAEACAIYGKEDCSFIITSRLETLRGSVAFAYTQKMLWYDACAK